MMRVGEQICGSNALDPETLLALAFCLSPFGAFSHDPANVTRLRVDVAGHVNYRRGVEAQ